MKIRPILIFSVIIFGLGIYLIRGSFIKEPFLRIPVSFIGLQNPCIQLEIEGKKYFFVLDSGSDVYFSVKNHVLDAIQKKEYGKTQRYDIKGNKYVSPLYLLELIKIGKMQVLNVTVEQESLDFILEGRFLKKNSSTDLSDDLEISGRVGAKFLRGVDFWLMDFPNSSLIALRKMPENLQNFAEAKMENIGSHIVVEVQTAIGAKKFVLDTGASRSIIRTPEVYKGLDHHILTTDQFIIGDHDFGSTQLYLFDMTSYMQFDGLLGRDFFQEHAVYLDFKNEKVFISKTPKSVEVHHDFSENVH